MVNWLGATLKVINSACWALLVRVLLNIGIEVTKIYGKMPEGLNTNMYLNAITAFVFILVVTTYKVHYVPRQKKQENDDDRDMALDKLKRDFNE